VMIYSVQRAESPSSVSVALLSLTPGTFTPAVRIQQVREDAIRELVRHPISTE